MKAELKARVYTVAYSDGFAFTGSTAQAVVSALKAGKDIKADALAEENGEFPICIPYSAVTHVLYYNTTAEDETEDANCIVRTPDGDSDEGEGN